MRAPVPSEPNYTFPTYQVPQVSAMRGSAAPTVQVARVSLSTVGAEPPHVAHCVQPADASSVINGSSCRAGNSNLRMQSVTDNCLLNSVTVPKIQRNVAHNNTINSSDKLASKSGALLPHDGQDIPGNQKADLILPGLTTTTQYLHDHHRRHTHANDGVAATTTTTTTTAAAAAAATTTFYSFERLVALNRRTRALAAPPPMRLVGGGESSLNTGTSGWGTPPAQAQAQQASNNNSNTSATSGGWSTANTTNQNNTGTQQWNNNTAGRPAAAASAASADASKSNANMPSNGGGSQAANGGNGSGWGAAAAAKSQVAQQSQQQGAPPNSAAGSSASAGNSTKQQLEQLSNMREAIFSQDGWGGQYVNQDTNWDIPDSPEPAGVMKLMDGGGAASASSGGGGAGGGGPPPWKPTVNNGTELWEANLRNGGQPPPQPQQKTPWGHTPTTNIGGTWGEDDDVADSSNVWTAMPKGGVPPGQQQQQQQQQQQLQQQQQQWSACNANNPMWSSSGVAGKKDADWNSAAAGGSASGWGAPDPRAPPPPMEHRDMRPDPRELRAAANDPMRMVDAQQQPQQQQIRLPIGEMRGDLRGITGRLNGSSGAVADGFWTQGGPPPSHHMHHQTAAGKMAIVGGGNAGGGGWEEPSPPSQRRNMPNYDDGTSLWGNPQQGGGGGGGGLQRGGAVNGPPGMAASARPTGMKPPMGGGDALWRSNGGASWADDGAPAVTGWGDDVCSWTKQKGMSGGGGGGGALWTENDMDWMHKQGPKPQPQQQQAPPPALAKEMIWNTKNFHRLVDMGYKKDDVENALRLRDMNMDDALELLNTQQRIGGAGIEWRRHDDHFEHQPFGAQQRAAGGGGGAGFPSSGPSAPQVGGYPPGSGTPNLMNSMAGSAAASNSLINNMSPAIVQKMLPQGGAGGGGGAQSFGAGGGAGSGGGRPMQVPPNPSTAQLRMLVQQIQMAVQAGYLNHQILNQPLAPTTLVLLNQLLQQIKALQQLANQQNITQNQCVGQKPNTAMMQNLSVFITKTKQQIANLQNQIASQQAIYVKQQAAMRGGGGGGGGGACDSSDIFKTSAGVPDSLSALNNFGELGIKDAQQSQQQQSRLNQWKLPALDKDEGGEFSRAPGSSSGGAASSKPLVAAHAAPSLNPLGLPPSNGPWSSGGRARPDSGWPDSSVAGDSVDLKDAQWPSDLVPEFEPGKPWKGNQKSIEDDPSITPGSVVRSPLSLPTPLKDTELFAMTSSKSPPTVGGVAGGGGGGGAADVMQQSSFSLSSSTWSYPPASSTPSVFASPQGKPPAGKAVAVGNAELWGAPAKVGPPPPPPGLAGKSGGGGGGTTAIVNGWSVGGGGGGGGGAAAGSWHASQRNNWSPSQWLLLRNLTAQIDGSTLRTLCMQHGPLENFHLYLHQGYALAKYQSNEEAAKAQAALNNCVLGNTTILAENPSDWEANSLLQVVGSSQSGGSGRRPQQADMWGTGWSSSNSVGGSAQAAALWPPTGTLDGSGGEQARGTPSNLQSFLPGDLLGGESI